MSEAQSAATNLIAELRQLEDQLDEVSKTLEAQRELLRRRRLAMPAAIINNLELLQRDFKRLENSVLEEQTELRQLRALSEMSTRITNSLNIETVLGETMELVIVLTNAERGYIVLANDDTGELEFRVSSEGGLMGPRMESGDRPQISMSVVNEVMSTGEPLLADNAFQDERLSENQSIINFTLRSVLCVPLRYKERVIGVVYVDNRLVAGIFTERELNLMMAFANTAAVAVANARMYMRAEQILAEITRVKELMDNIFSSVGSGIIAIDSNDLVHTFNRAAGEILDLPPNAAVGFDVAQVMKTAALEVVDHLDHVKEHDMDHSLEVSAELPGRGQVALALSLSPLKDSNDMTQGVTMVMDDVTHLYEHETTINAMKRILPEGMVDQINEIANIEMGGLRREVTCVFADVRPWSTLPDVAASEKLRILNQYQAIATACIHECGGIIDKYMGNEVMALFNTQLNPEHNHAQMALECGLLMRERFVELYRELGIQPEPHYYIIGMFTGVATLGNVGSFQRREFTALGNSINTAKRIQENAARGTITIVQQTLDHILANNGGRPYDFRPRDPIYGKGLSAGHERLRGIQTRMSEAASASGFGAIQTQLKGLKTRADEVKTLLEQQQELLRRRGISLPASAIDHLWTVRSSVDKLSLALVDSHMQLQQLRRLADTTALVNSAQATDEVLNEVMETVIQLTQAERGYIVLKNRETGALEFTVARGLERRRNRGRRPDRQLVRHQQSGGKRRAAADG